MRGEDGIRLFGLRDRALLTKGGALNGILALLLFIGVLALLVAHVFHLGNVRVDKTALILIGVLLFIPLLDVVRKIKIGNFFEAEISA